jgi:hypothetical protein
MPFRGGATSCAREFVEEENVDKIIKREMKHRDTDPKTILSIFSS